MATDKTLGLEKGDLLRVMKITRLMKMGPQGTGFSYPYIKQVLDANDPRQNEEIRAIAVQLVADRERSMAALAQVQAKKRRPNTDTQRRKA